MSLEERYQTALRHHEAGRWHSAEAAYRAVIAAAPRFAGARYNLGVVLSERGRFGPAIREFEAALKLQPDYAAASIGLGATFDRVGDGARAEAALRHAVALDAGSAPLWRRLGDVLRGMGQLAAARDAYDRAIALDPADAAARFGRGFVRLLEGDLPAAWEDYEFRPSQRGVPDPALAPRWRGEDPAGKRLLLYAEQGLGDTIQFLRYVPLLAARGARVLLAIPVPLMPLAAGLEGVFALVEPAPRLPPFDACCPLPSLPLMFRTGIDTLPQPLPYLVAPPDRLAFWQQRLGRHDGLTVALVWAGNPEHPNDHNRSLGLNEIAPLFDLAGVRWLLLQKGVAQEELRPRRGAVQGLGDALRDFADTAAVMSCADLVISVDTAACHLAGALARPVWTLLPFAPDWRWMPGRDDTPWYPGMRLYRQPRRGDWQGVVGRLAADLAALAAER